MYKLREMKNRGKVHMFLGDALSNGIDKTVVEPGNAFSPGLWTVGISLVVRQGELVAPQTRDLPWSFGEHMPAIVSEYKAGDAHVRSELCHIGGKGWSGVDYFRARIDRRVEDAALVISDVGPAGGRIRGMEWHAERNALTVDGGPTLEFETPVSIELLMADEAHDSPFAVAHFQSELKVRVFHGYAGRAFCDMEPCVPRGMSVDEGFVAAAERWSRALPARIYAPDARIERMWEQTAFHILSAMECGLPRISANNYPIFWIRDCVIVLKALDVMGRSDLARIGCDYLAPIVFSGGFGAESDNPGEGLWALSQHALMTRDADWARSVMHDVRRRVDWIERMLSADEPIYMPCDMRTIWAHWWPGSDLVCLAHERNHIHGRMDGHSPDFYINCWAYAGLDGAARIAELAGESELACKWQERAAALDAAIAAELLPKYGNERDSCVAPYPSGALQAEHGALRQAFVEWYDLHRLTPSGQRVPEELWTYFEAAQMHNAFMLGERERAWSCLDGFLSDARWQDMAIFTEGRWNATEMLPFGTGKYGRGWLQQGALGANMPHNWTSSEVMLLLRDMFVREEAEGLVLFEGVPGKWLYPGACFGFDDMPTRFGVVSVRAEVDEAHKVHVEFIRGGELPYRLALPE